MQRNPVLLVPRPEAERAIRDQVEKASSLLPEWLASARDVAQLQGEFTSWHRFNVALLNKTLSSFGGVEYSISHSPYSMRHRPSSEDEVRALRDAVNAATVDLNSLLGRLCLFDEATRPTSAEGSALSPEDARRVFIVHGRNNEHKTNVARFVEQLELQAVILHEQANQGQTIIDKLSRCGQVAFVIVIFSADDIGGLKPATANSTTQLAPRARQNVVFEWGYFIGKLGPSRVSTLVEPGVEMHSDVSGIAYISLDENGWKLKLAQELQAARLPFNASRLLDR